GPAACCGVRPQSPAPPAPRLSACPPSWSHQRSRASSRPRTSRASARTSHPVPPGGSTFARKSALSPARSWSLRASLSAQYHIRVVPLHRPEAQRVRAAVAPRLTYRGGPLLTAVEVFTVFWGAEWQQAPRSALATNLNLFFDFILTSALMDQLGEYSVPGKNIGHGRRTGTATLTSPAPNTSVEDSAIQQLLQQEIASKNLPAPGPNSLYFFFLPPGVQVVQGGSASCQDF